MTRGQATNSVVRAGSFFTFAAVLTLLASACGGDPPRAPFAQPQATGIESTCAEDAFVLDDENEKEPATDCKDQPEGVRCYGFWAAECDGKGKLRSIDNCRLEDEVCMPGK